MQNWLDRLTDLAALRGDQNMLKGALQFFTERTGFSGYAYLNMQQSHAVAVSNYHPEWQAEYFKRRFREIDPVIRRALSLRRTFTWSAEEDRSRLSKEERSFFAIAADFGIRSGITIPVRAAHGGLATFTLASDKPVLDLERDIDPVAAAAAVGQLHARIQFVDPTPSVEEQLRLAPKAAIYLGWIAEGKTMEEVAEIEGVTYNSVRVKIDRTRKRFDVHTITHLASLATRKKLI